MIYNLGLAIQNTTWVSVWSNFFCVVSVSDARASPMVYNLLNLS